MFLCNQPAQLFQQTAFITNKYDEEDEVFSLTLPPMVHLCVVTRYIELKTKLTVDQIKLVLGL